MRRWATRPAAPSTCSTTSTPPSRCCTANTTLPTFAASASPPCSPTGSKAVSPPCDASSTTAAPAGAVTSSIDALFLLGTHHYFTGAWDESEQATGEGLALCDDLGFQMLAWPGNFLHGLVAAARGDHDTVRAMTDRMAAWGFPRRVGAVQHYLAQVNTQAALAQGEYEAAFRHASMVSPPGELASTHLSRCGWSST